MADIRYMRSAYQVGMKALKENLPAEFKVPGRGTMYTEVPLEQIVNYVNELETRLLEGRLGCGSSDD